MSDEIPADGKPFRFRLRVRFDECDAQRVVFNARYGAYVDVAVLEYFRAIGFGELLVNGPLDYQLVKQTLEWKAAARFDDVLEISVRPLSVGNTSFAMAVDFRIAPRDAVITTAETTYVLVDSRALTKTAVPEEVRRILEGPGSGLLVDHSDCSPRRESQ